jgi:hypothetical protein
MKEIKKDSQTRDVAYENALERLYRRRVLQSTTDRASLMAYDGPVIAGKSDQYQNVSKEN